MQEREEIPVSMRGLVQKDPWEHRSSAMRCKTCMWFVLKEKETNRPFPADTKDVGRCRRHAPTFNGYPTVFLTDWCGDHRIDENKV